ncbi:MAG: hypothetical protein WEC83_00490 [Patescibacteria group bacterium]
MASDKTDSKKSDNTPAADALEDIAKAAAADTKDSDTPAADVLPAESAAPAEPQPTGELISAPAADAAPASTSPISTAPAEPMIVADKEVAPANSGQSGEKLAEEIEVLTGEIQALEAKIERLTSGATGDTPKTENPLQTADLPPISSAEPGTPPLPPKPTSPITEPAALPASQGDPERSRGAAPPADDALINKPSDSNASVPVPIMSAPVSTTNSSPVGDLYSDIKKREAEAPTPREELNEQAPSGESSGLAIIAEVIAVFGVVLFVILAVSPFFREMLGDDTYEAVGQIGWLSSLGTLGLGLILLLFTKGKGLFKIILFILLLLAAVLFLALQGSSLIAPITSYVEPLVQFYR